MCQLILVFAELYLEYLFDYYIIPLQIMAVTIKNAIFAIRTKNELL